MDLTGISALLIAELTGASLKTAHRWKRAGSVPAMAAQLIQLRDGRNLGALASTWDGFRLIDEELWTPEKHRYTAAELRAIPYRLEQLRELERDARRPRQYLLL